MFSQLGPQSHLKVMGPFLGIPSRVSWEPGSTFRTKGSYDGLVLKLTPFWGIGR